MEEVLGTVTVPLDGRFSSIRTSETNLGNFMCDVMASVKKTNKILDMKHNIDLCN